MEIAPGSILQRIYFKNRLKNQFPDGFTFCEIGAGNGWNTSELLRINGSGVAYDLNKDCCINNRSKNGRAVSEGKLHVFNQDFLTTPIEAKYDVVFSCMVIEHLNSTDLDAYFERARSILNPNGIIVCLVPSNMDYWGIEDEIAGHFKRYEFQDLIQIAINQKLKISDIAGLTYPISNILFGLSNRIISKSEVQKKSLDMQQRTELSGNRGVQLKTTYPAFFRLVLNQTALRPLHWLQLIFREKADSMVIYVEYKHLKKILG
jgi:SAM-dependent methyltransferase